MKVTQHELPVDGKTYVVLKREDKALGYVYSLDSGKTWHPQMHQAFRQAKQDGTLTVIGDPVSEGGEYEAFVLALFQEISSMEPGERLLLAKTDTQIVVLRESTVLAVRASTIDDVDFSTKE